MSKSDVCKRQFPTSKVNPRAVRVKLYSRIQNTSRCLNAALRLSQRRGRRVNNKKTLGQLDWC